MQVTQADDTNIRRVGVGEELINFRPSPNFKNMKKFLKIRSEKSETMTTASHAPAALALEPKMNVEKYDNKEIIKPIVLQPLSSIKEKKEVQPPLPPYPPPPNSPLNLNVVIKQEKEDDEGQANLGGEGDMNPDPQPPPRDLPADGQVQNEQNRPKKTICKEFIRGNCTRPVCKYAHEIDVSQLAGVFTFCWNYQNAVCTFPNCKFVHASVFEEAEFYRTGVLPPHARAHMQKQKPPPPPPLEEVHAVPTEQRPEEEFRAPLPRSTSPLKREWGEIEEFNTSPRDIECEHLAKKCKNCDVVEFSFKYHKGVFENVIQSSEEINKILGLLNKKSTKLFHVLLTLLKPATIGKAAVTNGLMNGGDKDMSVLEQLNSYVGNNRLSSAINDDNITNILGQNLNLSSLMGKLLCSADQTLPADTSRET